LNCAIYCAKKVEWPIELQEISGEEDVIASAHHPAAVGDHVSGKQGTGHEPKTND